jgi:hypothetical protein
MLLIRYIISPVPFFPPEAKIPSNLLCINPKRKENHLRNPHNNIPLRPPKEILPSPIPPQPHSLNLHRLKRIHRNTPHKTNMHPQPSMHPRTTQADKDAEFRRGPLRGRRAAVAAAVVLGGFLNLEELASVRREGGKGKGRRKDLRSSLGIYLPHGFARHACLRLFLSHSVVSFLSLYQAHFGAYHQTNK